MTRVFAAAVAVLMVALLAVSGAMAQPKTDKPADKPMEQKTEKQKVEGKVKSVDPSGMVTLEDGTKLAIPKSVAVPKDKLKPGATISAEYEEKDGRKVATSVQIKG